MKNSVIVIQSFMITTIVYALLAPIFFEMDNAYREEEENFVVDNDKNVKATMYNQHVLVESECNSPCPPSAEMCIAMCA
jgi:ABC-type uncharacterized transport system permease subunit